MLNVKIITQPIGPNGVYGSVDVAFVEGKLQASVNLSPKGCLDEAAKAVGGATAEAVATFVEGAIGLS